VRGYEIHPRCIQLCQRQRRAELAAQLRGVHFQARLLRPCGEAFVECDVRLLPDELGGAWHDGKVHRPLESYINDELLGQPDAGIDMTFSFHDLIAHVTKTRRLGAGAIIGSGTVSNCDRSLGSSCLAERRTLEQLEHGAPRTSFLKYGDRVRIRMRDAQGRDIFGTIDQRVVRADALGPSRTV